MLFLSRVPQGMLLSSMRVYDAPRYSHSVEPEGFEPSSEQVRSNAFYMLRSCLLSGLLRSATYLQAILIRDEISLPHHVAAVASSTDTCLLYQPGRTTDHGDICWLVTN